MNFSISTDYSTTNCVYIYVNGNEAASRCFTGPVGGKYYFNITPVFGNTFTIEVKASLDGHYDNSVGSVVPSYLSLHDTWVYFTAEPVKLRSYLTELKYIPPGADSTPQGFLLNETEIPLNKTYKLSEGFVKFWLKWDGTKNIRISNNIGIDSDGHLYVKSDTGATYTLDGALPIGQYVPVAIGWKQGYGYILVNTSIVRISWQGNLTISKIGDLDNKGSTIIDEFILDDSYIDENAALQVTGKETFSIDLGEKY